MAGGLRNEASSSSDSRTQSVMVDYGRSRSPCGYCRSPGCTSISRDLRAQSLTVHDYQDLLDQGWRRSGCFLYKPEMERTCCPSYTIRLKASDFVPSKEQHRVYKQMQRFLDGAFDVKKANVSEHPTTSSESRSSVHHEFSSPMSKDSSSTCSEEKNEVEKVLCDLSDQIDGAVCMFTSKEEFPSGIQLPKASVKKVSPGKRKSLASGSEDLLYSSNIAFQIAASIKPAQLGDKNPHQSKLSRDCTEEDDLSPKVIAEKLATSLAQTLKCSDISIRSCNGHINFYSSTKQVSSSEGAQNAPAPKKSGIKRGSEGNCLNNPQCSQLKSRRLELRLKRSSFDQEEYDLYRRYQLIVHNDIVTKSSYRRFLVDTPLLPVAFFGDDTVPPCGFGSFHQQYLIDGQLVAVGVIDILPKCVSSKYLFWDPDFAFLSLGKYSALQEIGWVKENQVHCPSLQYYYLGYYIHSCNKMRYKAAYRPSELLCPLRYQWVPFDIAKPLLDISPYVVLSDPSSQPQVTEDVLERLLDVDQQDANYFPMDEDGEMVESELESSDEEPSLETTSELENSDEEPSLETTS
ncbi:hypothetical protein QN277_015779 [Acacia crassicarpa]|uniref:Arginyl-tRNA--protein transferase n=1 Tax=Acacia crassicarpa TaxID=499986 RepID=A0AAE1JZ71_9FABA|nr:hypothetical protein QN277_015779 [Acacia crassicarpa]